MFQELNRGMPKLPTLRAYREMTPLKRREMRGGAALYLAAPDRFLIFTLLPIIASLIFSFMDLKITDGILKPPTFVGLDNYVQMAKDPQILVDWQRYTRLAVGHGHVWHDFAACWPLLAPVHCDFD